MECAKIHGPKSVLLLSCEAWALILELSITMQPRIANIWIQRNEGRERERGKKGHIMC